jgi:hypothetical protein
MYKYYIGDFNILANDPTNEAYVSDNSIDIIITDPPYPKEFLHVWRELAIFAARVLKPSGFLVTYAPQYYLGKIMVDMNTINNLAWYAQLVMTHDKARSTIFPRREICGYKPILVFQKLGINGKTSKPYKSFLDIIKGSGKEKGLHEWQQSQAELTPLIETFSKQGDTVLDPFMGSGTTLAAAIINGRNAIGFDIDPSVKNKVKVRLENIP